MSESFKTFWHGEALSPYEILSLVSFLRNGLSVELYSYDGDLTVPGGVTLLDAAQILPESRLRFYQPDEGVGGVALFSNLFR